MNESKQDFSLVEVNTSKLEKEFILLPVRLYKKDKSWVRPLDNDINEVFDPSKNKHFRNGEACRWLAVDNHGKTVGRVAAFFDKKIAANNKQQTGGMGFFESINNKEVAFLLFDRCKEWLKEKGMEAMDGPVNFGDRDRWWGLLVDGFNAPNYRMPYNFPYYREFFEDYGFKNYFEQYTYYRVIGTGGLDPVILEKAERVAVNPEYTFKHVTKKDMDKVPGWFLEIYNKAWARFTGVKPITTVHANALFNSLKPILDKKLLWFGFFNGEPVAFFLMLPEINPIIKLLGGSMNIIGKAKFFWYRFVVRKCTKAFGMIFGVVPEHQKRGVEGAIIMAFAKIAFSPGFKYYDLEFNWIGDFNPSMMHLLEQIGARIVKTHITYRLLFDPEARFERATRVNT